MFQTIQNMYYSLCHSRNSDLSWAIESQTDDTLQLISDIGSRMELRIVPKGVEITGLDSDGNPTPLLFLSNSIPYTQALYAYEISYLQSVSRTEREARMNQFYKLFEENILSVSGKKISLEYDTDGWFRMSKLTFHSNAVKDFPNSSREGLLFALNIAWAVFDMVDTTELVAILYKTVIEYENIYNNKNFEVSVQFPGEMRNQVEIHVKGAHLDYTHYLDEDGVDKSKHTILAFSIEDLADDLKHIIA